MRPVILCCILVAGTVLGASKPNGGGPVYSLQMRSDPWPLSKVQERCAEHLATINDADRQFIRYFDFTELPFHMMPAARSSLYFWLNSLSTTQSVIRPQPVPNTDHRIFWCDIRWYSWTPEAWEKVSEAEPYIREPVAPASRAASFIYESAGNAIVKGAWFIYYTSDTSEFIKNNVNKADDAFYYTLLYARHDKPPQNAEEFRDIWHVDLEVLKDYLIDRGAIVDQGDSIVSFHNRWLWRVRTKLGVYWRTFDVLKSAGDQDAIENPFPKKWDAGEHIVQDSKGAQFYLLTDGNDDRVEFGNPFIVRDTVTGGPGVVVTAKSCVGCHIEGIRPIKNAAIEYDKAGVKFRENVRHDLTTKFPVHYLKGKELRHRSLYLGNLDRLISDDQREYAEFVKNCNGLPVELNAKQFTDLRNWYASPLSLEQVARECGTNVQEISDALQFTAKGRLGRIILDGHKIPRDTWERGRFAEANLLLIEYRKASKMNKEADTKFKEGRKK